MASTEGLLRASDRNDKFGERKRAPTTYNPLYDYRLSRGGTKQYQQQFGDMYFLRLSKLRKPIRKIAEEEWSDFEIAGDRAQRVDRVLDVRQGRLCWVVGTVFMDMPLKPSILEDISRDHWVAGPPPRQSYFSSFEDTQVMLEDESGRLRLTGTMLQNNVLVTGVILAALGTENANGDFEVLDIHIPDLPDQPRRWQRDDEEEEDGMAIDRPPATGKKVALISGLSFSGSDADTLSVSLLTEFLLGELLDEPDQDTATNISRLIVAGNSISSNAIIDAPNPHDELKKPTQKKYGYDASAFYPTPTAHLDKFLSEILPSIPITIMPGEHDPANSSFPQQPIHPAMFPHARNYSSANFEQPEDDEPGWFDSVTNPVSFDLEGHRFLGTSGQNLDDILKYLPVGGPSGTDPEGRVDVMEAMLRWRCVAPTAPDTLWCYPFQDRDHFVLEACPHVFFIGNQPRFDTTIIEGPDGQKVRLLAVPSFKQTGQIILLDAETLEPELVKFEVDGGHTRVNGAS